MKKGPETLYTPELAKEIVELTASGLTTKEIAERVGVSAATIQNWKIQYPDFYSRVARARRTAVELRVEMMDEIAEKTPDVQRARLQCDNIKWRAARENPEQYGDRLEINGNVMVDINAALTEARRRALPGRDLPVDVESQVIDTQPILNDSASGSKPVDRPTPQENPNDIFD